jgi:hypothetical protein
MLPAHCRLRTPDSDNKNDEEDADLDIDDLFSDPDQN